MKIHRDTFYDIIQDVINEYDENVKITIRFIAPQNFFIRDMYANVSDIIKALMYKKEYIYDKYDYPENVVKKIIGVYNKIINKLCNYIYERCSEYRENEADYNELVKTMFEISEPKALNIEKSIINSFQYPKKK